MGQKIKMVFSEAIKRFDALCIALYESLSEWWTLIKLGAKP